MSKGKEEEDDDPEHPGNQTYPNGYTTSVPDVRGRTIDDALGMLADAGFSGSVEGYQSSNSMISGRVISQTISGDAQAGTTVGLIVSSGAD